MFRLLKFTFLLGMLLMNVSQSRAETEARMCQDSKLGFRFYCETDWQMEIMDQAILVLLSDEPDVTAIIAQIDTDIKFLSQLTDDDLNKKNRYADNFRSYRISLNGEDILLVKGFARDDPNKRLQDYYLMNDQTLYGILFSVSPKTEASQYVPLFRSIVESFSFL